MIYVGKTIESSPFVPARFIPSGLKNKLTEEHTLGVIESESRRINRIGNRLPLSYAEAIHKARGRPVYEAWIHMPIVGAMIHFKEEDLSF